MKLGELNALVGAMKDLTPDERVKWQQILKGIDTRLTAMDAANAKRWAQHDELWAELAAELLDIRQRLQAIEGRLDVLDIAVGNLDSRVTALGG